MIYNIIFFGALACIGGELNAHAQRIYAPAMNQSNVKENKFAEDLLVYVLKPDDIKNITTTESRIHIQLTDSAKSYFESLTTLNVGKPLVVKNAAGETLQEAIIQRPITSGLIISQEMPSRGAMLNLAQRTKDGREKKIVDSGTWKAEREMKKRDLQLNLDMESFDSTESIRIMKDELNMQNIEEAPDKAEIQHIIDMQNQIKANRPIDSVDTDDDMQIDDGMQADGGMQVDDDMQVDDTNNEL